MFIVVATVSGESGEPVADPEVIIRGVPFLADSEVADLIEDLQDVVDESLEAFAFETSRELSVFVGLIITNCIVLGRTESFGSKNPVGLSFLDGLGNGLGYSVILILVATTRELDPVSVRRTAFRYSLRSEASLRFEKGQEHRMARLGADVELLGFVARLRPERYGQKQT